MSIASQIVALDQAVDAKKLPASSMSFAKSLISQYTQKGRLSPKQADWVVKLVDQANSKTIELTKPRETVAIGSMKPVVEMFAKAAEKLKQPKIILALENRTEIKLFVAGERSRTPGAVNVVKNDKFDNIWYGRIYQDGKFEKSPRVTEMPAGLIKLLERFAANPAEVAAEFGRLTGKCCFCNKTLKDERSTEVGYGPICAQKFGLSWG